MESENMLVRPATGFIGSDRTPHLPHAPSYDPFLPNEPIFPGNRHIPSHIREQPRTHCIPAHRRSVTFIGRPKISLPKSPLRRCPFPGLGSFGITVSRQILPLPSAISEALGFVPSSSSPPPPPLPAILYSLLLYSLLLFSEALGFVPSSSSPPPPPLPAILYSLLLYSLLLPPNPSILCYIYPIRNANGDSVQRRNYA